MKYFFLICLSLITGHGTVALQLCQDSVAVEQQAGFLC